MKTTSEAEAEMNAELYLRNVPSSVLQPYISVRPVPTKYSIMPIVDPRRRNNVPLQVEAPYNVGATFNPGNDTAPWYGYASKVNTESELKNQIFALQHCDQREYVPSSSSDLYQVSLPSRNDVQQQHPHLFKEQTFEQCNPAPEYASMQMFHNSTRADMRMSGQNPV